MKIVGNKVTLRDFQPADVDDIWYWNFAAEDREHLNWNGPYGPQEFLSKEQLFARYMQRLQQAHTDELRQGLVIEIDGVLKGTVSRYWVDERTNWEEIGIAIFDSSYWSGGYGTEAFSMWVDYLFSHSQTVRLGIATWSGNERMMRLAAKVGMIEEARIRKARIVHGAYYDSVKMGMLREEWEARKNSLFVPHHG